MRKTVSIDGAPARGVGLLVDVHTYAALEQLAFDRRRDTGDSNVGVATIAREAIKTYVAEQS